MIKPSLMIGGLVAACTLLPMKAMAAAFSQLIVYGDSLSDLGRASAATEGLAPPYSMLTNGWFSNGLIWVEYLAGSLGLPTNPQTNFAVGGATTGTINTVKTAIESNPLAPPLPNLNDLIGVETQVNNNLINDPNALYIIWAGANDYLGAGVVDPTLPLTHLSTQLGTLIGHGARNILVPNLPSLGNLPGTLNQPFAPALNLLTQAHNDNLAIALNNLQLLFPQAKITLLDINRLFTEVQGNPNQFGFTNLTEGCIIVSCSNPNEYFFWDDVHPTTGPHQLISNLAVQSLGIPEPSLIFGLMGTVSLGGLCLRRRSQ